MLDKAKDLESVGVLHSRQNVATNNPGTSSIGSSSQILKKKTKKISKTVPQVLIEQPEKDKKPSKGANQTSSSNN